MVTKDERWEIWVTLKLLFIYLLLTYKILFVSGVQHSSNHRSYYMILAIFPVLCIVWLISLLLGFSEALFIKTFLEREVEIKVGVVKKKKKKEKLHCIPLSLMTIFPWPPQEFWAQIFQLIASPAFQSCRDQNLFSFGSYSLKYLLKGTVLRSK